MYWVAMAQSRAWQTNVVLLLHVCSFRQTRRMFQAVLFSDRGLNARTFESVTEYQHGSSGWTCLMFVSWCLRCRIEHRGANSWTAVGRRARSIQTRRCTAVRSSTAVTRLRRRARRVVNISVTCVGALQGAQKQCLLHALLPP
jgi:hypothetical protein